MLVVESEHSVCRKTNLETLLALVLQLLFICKDITRVGRFLFKSFYVYSKQLSFDK